MKHLIHILFFLLISQIALAKTDSHKIKLIEDAPVLSRTHSGGKYVLQFHNFDQHPFEDLLEEVEFRRDEMYAFALKDQQIESSGTFEFEGETFYKVGIAFYVPAEFVEVMESEDPEQSPQDSKRQVESNMDDVVEEGAVFDSSPYVHDCTTGVCYDTMKVPLQITKLIEAVGDAKVSFDAHDEDVVTQAKKCLKDDCLTVDQRRAFFTAFVGPYAQDCEAKYGISASVCAGQAAQETYWGRKIIGDNALWGVKARAGAPSVNVTTHENIKGREILIKDNFRTYSSPEEAVNHYGQVVTSERYQRNYRKSELLGGANDFYNRATGIVRERITGTEKIRALIDAIGASGYATDPLYANKVFRIIQFRKNNLQRLDGLYDSVDQSQ